MLEQELKEGVQGTTGTAGTKALLGEMKMGEYGSLKWSKHAWGISEYTVGRMGEEDG